MKSSHQDLELVKHALEGNKDARQRVSNIADPIIRRHNNRLCQRYCFDNFRHYRCTLIPAKNGSPQDAPLCEWGNGGYHWMLEDLTKDSRLKAYQAKAGAGLENYLNIIGKSLAFFERWKDWRFGQRTYVPSYIQELHDKAGRIFLALKAQDTPENIAQRIGLDESTSLKIADDIIIELTRRNRLHLLEPTQFVSIDHKADEDDESESAWEIPHHDMPFEDWQQFSLVQQAWDKLDSKEQYVVEALVIEGRDAAAVLQELREQNISIKKGVNPAQTNRQQLYYFRRKSLNKLAKLAGLA